MRIAALYDIHGNLPALEAVLAEVRRAAVDLVVIGGDVFPGPMAGEALACLLRLELPVRFLRGNGDRVVAALADGEQPAEVPEPFRASLHWEAQHLAPEHRQQIASWPATVRLEIPGLGEVLFCHATPQSDTEIFTRLTPEDRLLEVFAGLEAPLVVCGHTHMQFDRKIGSTRVVNAGSVGMPFAAPGAYWLLLEGGAGVGVDVELRHTPYDLQQAAARIRATDHPQAQNFATRNVLQPPSESEMLERFMS
jgi:putative phosphoesterase